MFVGHVLPIEFRDLETAVGLQSGRRFLFWAPCNLLGRPAWPVARSKRHCQKNSRYKSRRIQPQRDALESSHGTFRSCLIATNCQFEWITISVIIQNC